MIFNRLSDHARGSVEAAFGEARALGHDSLGDEDLLLGVLRTGEGVGAAALFSLGVTREDAEEECEEMLSEALASVGISLQEIRRQAGEAFDMAIPEGRRIPFSPAAKNALVEARKQMRALGDDHLGTEHILLGLLANEEGPALRVLARLGVSPGALTARIGELRTSSAG